ncbi:hypothetical protein CRENBAI_018104 [Crenichthys baileyi]|uniref:Uncharacterized protein n=1 Tax=Crenichthys baileyi TaxID=28760 RepID=A0AAV9SEP3_9TELE
MSTRWMWISRVEITPHTFTGFIRGEAIEMVNSIKYLRVHISSDLEWITKTISVVKKAHKHISFIRRLKQNGSALGGAKGTKNSLLQPAFHRGHLHHPMRGNQHYRLFYPPSTWTVEPSPIRKVTPQHLSQNKRAKA